MTCPKCQGPTATDVNEIAWCVLCGTRAGKADVWADIEMSVQDNVESTEVQL